MGQEDVAPDTGMVALSAVLSDVYDAALDPDGWPRALGSVCAFVGGSIGQMFWHDAAAAQAHALYSHNDDAHHTRLYLETYAPLCPIFPAATFAPVGTVSSATDHVPEPELHQTRFYREWMAPQDMTDALAVLLEKDRTRSAFLALQWKGVPIDDAARQRMELLVPHLLRAVAIGRLFLDRTAERNAFTETLEHVDAGVFLVAKGGRIVFANATARRMTDDGRLVREDGGCLRGTRAASDRAIARTLREIEAGERLHGHESPVIPLSEAGDDGWGASVLPLVDGERRGAGRAHHAIAAVFLRSQVPPPVSPLEALAERYGLTGSEIRVAEAALRMSGLDTMAEALGISRATVKTHLNRVYRKTGARNQAELIRLIAGFGP
jgi:DNA-binding CsgD family transcriptional regulator/PAS domain-containing protein